jgi:hypothetical protein
MSRISPRRLSNSTGVLTDCLGDFSSTEPKLIQCEKLEGGREADLPHDILVALVRMQKIIGRPGLKPD